MAESLPNRMSANQLNDCELEPSLRFKVGRSSSGWLSASGAAAIAIVAGIVGGGAPQGRAIFVVLIVLQLVTIFQRRQAAFT